MTCSLLAARMQPRAHPGRCPVWVCMPRWDASQPLEILRRALHAPSY